MYIDSGQQVTNSTDTSSNVLYKWEKTVNYGQYKAKRETYELFKYTSYYQNGVQYIKRDLVPTTDAQKEAARKSANSIQVTTQAGPPAVAPAFSGNGPQSSTPVYTNNGVPAPTPAPNVPTTNAQPTNVPSPPSQPSYISEPNFTAAQPVRPSAFSFNETKPVLKQITVPQPPPTPKYTDISQIAKPIDEVQQPLTMYSYVYGIKELAISYIQYQPKSVFVSQPIQINGNIMQVSLSSHIDHPVFDDILGTAASRQTSVEFYVAAMDNPNLSDWYPILPEEETSVKSELLIFDTEKTATLRFPALLGAGAVVYQDNKKMNTSDWTLIDNGQRVQLTRQRNPVSIYMIDYEPNVSLVNPWMIDIQNTNINALTKTDVFPNGTDHNKTITLSEYPFTDYEQINSTVAYSPNTSTYKPVQVNLTDAQIIGPSRANYTSVDPYDGTDNQNAYTLNRTNYQTGEWPVLKPYSINSVDSSLYKGFEYWQEGNKLHFSETFNNSDIYTNEQTNHGNATIKVTYQYLSTTFRLKMILRRNSSAENTLTPVVHDYTLNFKVMS